MGGEVIREPLVVPWPPGVMRPSTDTAQRDELSDEEQAALAAAHVARLIHRRQVADGS